MKYTYSKKYKCREIILFLERLELCLSAGVSISGALDVASQGLPSRLIARTIVIRKIVEAGGSFSTALVEYMGLSLTLAGLIEHGQSSGTLAGALCQTKTILERQDELRKRCFSALIYPVVIGIFAGLVTIGLVKGIMPQIIPLLKNLHVSLPLITRIVIAFSEGLLVYGVIVVIVTIVVGIILLIVFKHFIGFRYFCHKTLLLVPLVGNIVFNYFLAVFLRSFGAMVQSGMAHPHAYFSVVEATYLLPLKFVLQQSLSDINAGYSVGQIFRKKHIPPFVASIITAGEISGTLGICITRAADILDRDIDHSLKRATALIEPVMMILVGAVVGVIAVSIILPIYDISKVLQH